MSATIGNAVQRTREDLGLSLSILAQQAGVSDTELAAVEAGRPVLAASSLMSLARAMGLPATSFLTDARASTAQSVLDRAKFFHVANAPTLSENDIVALMRETTRSELFAELTHPPVRLDAYKPSRPGSKPWQQGYSLALSLREKLGAVDEPIISVQACLEDRLGVLVAKLIFADIRLHAAALRGAKGRLVVVSKRLSVPLLRISLAHELCHHLCDLHPNESRGEVDDHLEGYSGTEPKEEQRAKAFSVMFLAPTPLLRKRFGRPGHQLLTAEAALAAASELAACSGIGGEAALWHLFNLKYISGNEEDIHQWKRHIRPNPLTGFEPSLNDGLDRAIEAALVAEEIDPDRAEWLRNL